MDLTPLYGRRDPKARKGDHGTVLVVGGSEWYAGAVAFNAMAALLAGADLALVVAPRRAADIVAGYGPDLITIPCDAPHPEPAVVRNVQERADALVVGGGVARSPEAHRALREIMRAFDGPLVADAEALRALAAEPGLLKGRAAVLTPHPGEFQAMSEVEWPKDASARGEAAAALARRFGATVLVKGHVDHVTDGERHATDVNGSPYLTKGGYGDLMAGVAGALLARGASPFDAARGAAFIVGKAGEMAAADLGESTLASDAMARIPLVVPRTV